MRRFQGPWLYPTTWFPAQRIIRFIVQPATKLNSDRKMLELEVATPDLATAKVRIMSPQLCQ